MGNASAVLQIAMRMFELTDAEDLNYVDEDDGDWWLADTLEDYDYSRIRQSLEAMKKLENGNAAAHQLAEHFREVYRHRPSFMAEISKF